MFVINESAYVYWTIYISDVVNTSSLYKKKSRVDTNAWNTIHHIYTKDGKLDMNWCQSYISSYMWNKGLISMPNKTYADSLVKYLNKYINHNQSLPLLHIIENKKVNKQACYTPYG